MLVKDHRTNFESTIQCLSIVVEVFFHWTLQRVPLGSLGRRREDHGLFLPSMRRVAPAPTL